ncbi:MAG TPA: serine hydrolase [Candidatus Acidoferrales bacterium]|nr:serine hydrolase [Candidatus Acidoferrales bacterium]
MISHTAFHFAIGVMLLRTTAFAQAPMDSTVPPDAEIRQILAGRIGGENLGIGMVAGVIDAKGRRVVAYGSLAKDDKRPLNGDTVFEIGSITKVFTSLLLMDMVQRGEVALTDPVSKYLPPSVKVPERRNRKITLQDLSTQSSGLPRMPSNFTPKDELNPYADYSVEQMYQFVSGYQLTRDIGEKYEYSNLGVGLLGHVLSLRAGMDYEALVRARICEPLGMPSTRVTLTPEMKARLAIGHSGALIAVPNWDIPTLAGAGALRSTTNDLLTFLAANMGYVKTPLAAAMAAEVSVRKPAGASDMEIAYGWHVQTKDGQSIIWHNGGTGGYRTFMGFDPKRRAGVVVLSNISTPAGPDDIGRHLLNASYPLLKIEPPREHKEVTVDTKTYDSYVGSYQLGPNAILTISREGDRLFVQLTGQPKFQLFPEGERKFFLKVVDAQITFDADAQGKTTQAVLHQGGRDQVAKRMDEAEAKRAADEDAARAAAVARDAEVAKRFRGPAQSPGTEAALRRSIEELRLGQPKYELMNPAFADLTRQKLPQLKTTVTELGSVESVSFKGVGPGGFDIYEVRFEHGLTEWRIGLGPDGKIEGIGFQATPGAK